MPLGGHVLKLTPDRLEFADSGTSETLKVCLENLSPSTTCFKVRLKAGDSNKFFVSPVTGSIKPNEKTDVAVKYKPTGERTVDTKLQIKYVELKAGQSFDKNVFEEEKDTAKTLMLPFIFTDLEAEADDMYKTPQANWWRK